jgi:3-methylcrotonyl-CoA carboxylase alpha subunit
MLRSILNVVSNAIGYGFLSENASFAARCEAAGFIFIGPQPASITAMGSKSGAKQLLSSPPYAGKVPLIPGYNGADQSLETLEKQALNVGFPLLIKAAAGGGGKGMRIVHDPAEVATELASAKREAKAAFGDDTVLLERYFDTVKRTESLSLSLNRLHFRT